MIKGSKHSAETILKLKTVSRAKTTGSNNGKWKDSNLTYQGIHAWVFRKFDKPRFCENCEDTTKKMYHWANLSGEYKRDISDWARLCASCHMMIDGVGHKSWATRRRIV